MNTWQPDWGTLEATASTLAASDPLAARIATVTPPGGYVAIALRPSLADVIAEASSSGALTAPLIVAADTLLVPAGDTVVPAPAMAVIARSIEIDGGGAATLHLRSDESAAGIEVTTAGISGTLNAAFETAAGAPVAGGGNLALSGVRTPQVLTAFPGTAGVTSSTDAQAVADSLHEPWAIVALELSGAIASTLIDDGSDDALALAAAMLRWVVGGCSALLDQRAQFPTVDFTNLASLQTSAIGLLAFTQSQTSGATYVPVLSASVYQQQIDALLQVAATYDAKIAAFASQQNLEQLLAEFAETTGAVYKQAQTPLLNSLKRLADESGSVESQLLNAAVQLNEVSATLAPLQQALVKAIDDQFQQDLVKTALDTLFTLATLYVGAAAALLGDPQVLQGEASAVIKAATDMATQLIDAGQKTIDGAIGAGAQAANSPPSAAASQAAAEGAQYLTGSLASFGAAIGRLWAVVARATSGTLDLSPDLVAAVEPLPDLSGFSVGGLDPTTYWDAVVIQTKASLQPFASMPEAQSYQEALELAATYGRAVGDLQMKLLELYTQGMAAFDQLQEVYQAKAKWDALQQSLQTDAEKAAAAQGLLQRGYLDVKRSLVLAVENYRAAFLYQWLQPADVQVDVSMDLTTLEQQARSSISGLEQVLAGTGTGTVRPRQKFEAVSYRVSQQPLFDEQGQAQWTIDTAALARQLNGNAAIYLTAATFQLEGNGQNGGAEIELEAATSGHYSNQLGGTEFRFVSQPVSMINDYYPGAQPRFVTKWEFADAASYLAPTPYTNWTLTVKQGDWKDATGIDLTFSGILLQNPS